MFSWYGRKTRPHSPRGRTDGVRTDTERSFSQSLLGVVRPKRVLTMAPLFIAIERQALPVSLQLLCSGRLLALVSSRRYKQPGECRPAGGWHALPMPLPMSQMCNCGAAPFADTDTRVLVFIVFCQYSCFRQSDQQIFQNVTCKSPHTPFF